ncbi:MAG: SDR family oxidoreductase [Chloroflexi bacterium]|nr:SDR family oxidoreductase [Chloroflexota bacterium]
MGQMDGMVAIVTGASRGLGRAVAAEYAKEGASLVICARAQSPTGLDGTLTETAEHIRAAGGDVLAVDCDVTDESQVNEMVRQATERYGRIDVLFNNAGSMVLGESILEIDAARWEQLMRVNVNGPYFCSRAVLPTMMAQRRGSIVNIGSRMATDPNQGGGVLYSASKAAVHMFSYCLADEVRDYNIAVNILSPGGLRSEGSAAIPWTQRDWHERVEPSAIGPLAVFLALQDASTFTGQLASRFDYGTTWGPGLQQSTT